MDIACNDLPDPNANRLNRRDFLEFTLRDGYKDQAGVYDNAIFAQNNLLRGGMSDQLEAAAHFVYREENR